MFTIVVLQRKTEVVLIQLLMSLTTAMTKILDTISLDQVKLNTKLNAEIHKFKKLQAMFLGKKKTEKIEAK